MGIPQEQTFDVAQFQQDRQMYNYWFRKQFGAGDDEDDTRQIAGLLYAAVRLELTQVQRLYFSKYYFEGLTMEEIARNTA